MMAPTLHTLAPMLQVADVAASAAYFRDRLGFEVYFVAESETLPGYAVVARDELELHLLEDRGRDAEQVRSGLNATVNDVDALYEQFRTNEAFDEAFPRHLDAIREHPPEDKEYGLRDMIFVNPDGYILVFGTPME